MKSNIKFSIETITPKIAREILEKNHAKQRNVVMGHVRFLADQIKSGQWKTNGEPIIFSPSGDLLDGQHRIHAIILANESIEIVVVRGVEDSAMTTINTGKTRSNSNVFAMNGIENYNIASSFCYLVWRYRRAIAINGSINMSTTKPSNRDLIEIYSENVENSSMAVKMANKVRTKGFVASVSAATAFLALEAGHQPEVVQWFFSRLGDGVELAAKSPILALINKQNSEKDSRSKLPIDIKFAMMVKAFNLYAQVKEARTIIVQRGEKFPSIVKP